MWCVVNCLGSIAAGNEEDVAMVIDSAMWKRLVAIMEDERLNWGLLTEFVYLVSNLVFSGTNEQVETEAMMRCSVSELSIVAACAC